MSATPKLEAAVFAKPINSVVVIVIVGILNFSSSTESWTSHDVQFPQSPCEEITISGLNAAIAFACWMLILGVPLLSIPAVSGATS